MQLFPLISCQLLRPEAVTAAGVGIRSGSSEPASWQGSKHANICPADSLALSRQSCLLKKRRRSGQISVANHSFSSLPDRPSPHTTLQYLIPLPLLDAFRCGRVRHWHPPLPAALRQHSGQLQVCVWRRICTQLQWPLLHWSVRAACAYICTATLCIILYKLCIIIHSRTN